MPNGFQVVSGWFGQPFFLTSTSDVFFGPAAGETLSPFVPFRYRRPNTEAPTLLFASASFHHNRAVPDTWRLEQETRT